MTEETRRLYLEIANKDWKEELETYKKSLSKAEVVSENGFEQSQVVDFDTAKPYMVISMLIGFLAGLLIPASYLGTALVAAGVIALFGLSGTMGFIGFFVWLGSLVVLSGFSAILILFSALEGQTLVRLLACIYGCLSGSIIGIVIAHFNQVAPRDSEGLKHVKGGDNLCLSPRELLVFWEGRLDSFIHAKRWEIKEQTKKIKENLAQTTRLHKEGLTKNAQHAFARDDHQKAVIENKIGLANLQCLDQALDQQAQRIQERILGLKEDIIEVEKLEDSNYRKARLQEKVRQLTEQTKLVESSWNGMKGQLEIDLRNNIDQMKNELQMSGDLAETYIELEDRRRK